MAYPRPMHVLRSFGALMDSNDMGQRCDMAAKCRAGRVTDGRDAYGRSRRRHRRQRPHSTRHSVPEGHVGVIAAVNGDQVTLDSENWPEGDNQANGLVFNVSTSQGSSTHHRGPLCLIPLACSVTHLYQMRTHPTHGRNSPQLLEHT